MKDSIKRTITSTAGNRINFIDTAELFSFVSTKLENTTPSRKGWQQRKAAVYTAAFFEMKKEEQNAAIAAAAERREALKGFFSEDLKLLLGRGLWSS